MIKIAASLAASAALGLGGLTAAGVDVPVVSDVLGTNDAEAGTTTDVDVDAGVDVEVGAHGGGGLSVDSLLDSVAGLAPDAEVGARADASAGAS